VASQRGNSKKGPEKESVRRRVGGTKCTHRSDIVATVGWFGNTAALRLLRETGWTAGRWCPVVRGFFGVDFRFRSSTLDFEHRATMRGYSLLPEETFQKCWKSSTSSDQKLFGHSPLALSTRRPRRSETRNRLSASLHRPANLGDCRILCSSSTFTIGRTGMPRPTTRDGFVISSQSAAHCRR